MSAIDAVILTLSSVALLVAAFFAGLMLGYKAGKE